MVLALGALLAAGVVGACLSMGPRGAPLPRDPGGAPVPGAPREASAPLPPPVPDPWRASRRVPLRIGAAEGLAELEIELDGERRAQFTRRGQAVVDSEGASAGHFVLEPRGFVRLLGRRYDGPIAVEVRAEGGLRAHAWLDLETYVSGVVAAEVALWNAPTALLEAQAVAARSYAVAQLDARAKQGPRPVLFDSVLDQAFHGHFEGDAAARARGLDQRLAKAIETTRGRVLERDGRVLDARFHGSCGGNTADFATVFTEPDPGAMVSVPCPGCIAANKPWSHTFAAGDLGQLARRLGLGDRLVSLRPGVRDGQGRWRSAHVVGSAGERDLSLQDLRRELGWQIWRSGSVRRLWPADGTLGAGGLFVEGVGHGHGVGLCQNGARALADGGADFRAILGHYYRGARLARLP